MFEAMLATPGPVPSGASWAHEVKWDGLRALVTVAGGVSVVSRRGLRYATYPVEQLADAVPDGTVLDGELVVLDDRGVADFAAVAPFAQGTRVRGVQFLPFDVLVHAGTDLTGRTWRERRTVLEALDVGAPGLLPGGDGPALLEAARELGLEGLVSKQVDSCCEQGRRSRSWVKTKVVLHADVVVGSWEEASDARPFGSLGMGEVGPDGRLLYRGQVGTGWNRASMAATAALLVPASVSPFVKVPRAHEVAAHWLEPTVRIEVGHAGLSVDGLYRHPRFRRVVED